LAERQFECNTLNLLEAGGRIGPDSGDFRPTKRKRELSRIGQIQRLVRDGLYYLTQHADEEAAMDGFDIYDAEQAILTGKIRKTWPKQGKFEVVGSALDRRRMGVVCRITGTGKVRVITVYEDRTKS
jgi:hypothetical protein